MILIVLGLPGSGKSFFATRMAEELNAEYLSSDIIRKELFAQRNYSKDEKKQVYEKMLGRMKEVLTGDRHVILDASFYKKEIRQAFYKAANEASTPILIIEIRAEEKLIRKRLSQKRENSEADYEVYRKVKKQFEPVERPHLVLESGADNIDEVLRQARHHFLQLQ